MQMPLPQRIQDAPDLGFGLTLYFAAFWDLDTCRPVGFGYGPIPWSAVRDYALTFGFDEEQEEALFYLVRKLDNAYLEHKAKKNAP